MSKEKLSAEEWLNLNYDPEYVHYENDGVKRIKDIPHSELCNRMEAYAEYKTEQLQRERDEIKLSRDEMDDLENILQWYSKGERKVLSVKQANYLLSLIQP